MDYQQSHQVDYISTVNSVNSQLQDFGIGSTIGSANPISGSSTPLGGVPQIHRSVSLMDTLGIQRTQSPFHNAPGNDSPSIFSQQTSIHWNMNSGINTGGGEIPFNAAGPGNGMAAGTGTGDIHTPISCPPGIITNVQQTSWQYLDHSNQVQGPFDSEIMDQWYNAGFFNESLHLMPMNSDDPFHFSGRFIMFNDLLSKTGIINPFHAFDMICFNHALASAAAPSNNMMNFGQKGSSTSLMQQHVLGQSQAHPANLSQRQPKPFDLPASNTTISSSSTTPVPVLQNMISKGLHFDNNTYANIDRNFQSPDLSHSQILQLKNEDGSYYQNTTVSVPFSKHVQAVDSFELPLESVSDKSTGSFAAKSDTYQLAPQTYQTTQPIRSVDATSIKDQYQPTNAQTEASNSTANDILQQNIPAKEPSTDPTTNSVSVEKSKEAPVKAKTEKKFNADVIQQLILEEELERKKKEEKKKKKEQKPKNIEENSKVNNRTTSSQSKSDEKKEASPWSATPKPAVQTMSLSDIQRRDAEEKRKREAERERKEREAALKLQHALLAEEQKTKFNVSSVASWANPVGTKAPAKAPVKTTSRSTPEPSADSIKYIEEQRRILEEIQNSQNKSSASPSSDSWSTIAKKKTSLDSPRPAPQINNSFLNPGNTKKKILHGSSISIPTLKKGVTSSPINYSGNQSTSARRQFLSWCRSQMKLAPGVKVDSVLEMLLSLPPSMDSKEIISDTIYANSSVMEGRSFASEFIKRRIECEKSLNDPLTWSEALALPQGSADDWEFQVVSKKKGKRN